MSHGNPIDIAGTAKADAEVIAEVESSPIKYVSFRIEAGKDNGPNVAQKLVGAWNKYYGGAQANGGRVTFPGNVLRMRLTSCCEGTIAIQDVPDAPRDLTIAGLKVSSPP